MKYDLLKDKPKDLIEFCVDWLHREKNTMPSKVPKDGQSKQQASRPPIPKMNNNSRNMMASSKIDEVKLNKVPTTQTLSQKNSSKDSEDDDDDYFDAEDEQLAKMQAIKVKTSKGGRGSVSSEVFGMYNKRESYVPVKVMKTDDQRKAIRSKIDTNIFLKNLPSSDKEVIEDSMSIEYKSKGDIIIKQGDEGDYFYILDSGEASCSKDFGDGKGDTHLKNYQPGEGFGELAL